MGYINKNFISNYMTIVCIQWERTKVFDWTAMPLTPVNARDRRNLINNNLFFRVERERSKNL